MNDNIKKYKLEIEECENVMLGIYNNLVVAYEEMRVLYEKVIEEYEGLYPIAKCSRLVCYNSEHSSVTWKIIKSNGIVAYESTPHLKNQTFIIDLKTILIPNTEFTLHCSVFNESWNCIYIRDSNTTAYFNSSFNLQYYGVVPLFYTLGTVKYLECSSLYLSNSSDFSTKYVLYDLSGVQIYETGPHSPNSQMVINLIDLCIQSYTVFKLKAVSIDGIEVITDVTVEYVVDNKFEGNFRLVGTLDENEFMYFGVGQNSSYDPSIKKCSYLVGYSLIGDVTNWQILGLDDSVLYTSSNYLQYETFVFDLSTLKLETGTQFRLKSINSTRKDVTSSTLLEYHLNSETVYFQSDYTNMNPVLYFNGSVPTSTTPPVLKCSRIATNHTAFPIIMKWSLINEKGIEIYTSSRCSKEETSFIDLSTLGIAKGTRLKLKAVVTAAADSTAYILIEYDPGSIYEARFGFYGNSFKTIVPYNGLANS